MKRFLQITGAVVILGVGYFCYDYFFDQTKISEAWNFIPNQTVAVVEIASPSDVLSELDGSGAFSQLAEFKVIGQLQRAIPLVDSILKKADYSVHDLMGDKQVLAALVQVKESVEPVFLMPIAETDGLFIDAFTVSQLVTTITKESEGITYYTIKVDSLQAYVFIGDGMFRGSFSERALIQSVTGGVDLSIAAKNNYHRTHEVDTEEFRIFLNMKAISFLLTDWSENELKPFSRALSYLTDDAFLDVTYEDDVFRLTGFSHTADTAITFLGSFNEQEVEDFILENYVSNNTITLSYLGVSDPMALHHDLSQLWYSHDNKVQAYQEELKKSFQLNLSEVFDLIDQEVGYAVTESNVGGFDRFLYLHVDDAKEAVSRFRTMAELSLSETDTLAIEPFRDFEIISLGIKDLPYAMFGEYFEGFGDGYYVQVDDYAIVASSSQALKLLIDDIENDNVWGRSMEYNRDIDEFFVESNVGLMVNTQKALNTMKALVSKSGSDKMVAYESLLQNLEFLSFQFGNDAGKYYTNIALKFGEKEKSAAVVAEERTSASVKVKDEVAFEFPLISKPKVVRNHVDKSFEVLVQDEAFKLFLISSTGSVLWEYQLDGRIIDEIEQVDVYKNRKLQYLFATENKVYCLDRKGGIVENYPFGLPNGQKITTLRVADYDKSKNYRLFASDASGSLFLFTIEGKVLDGWNPNKAAMTPLANSARHIRVKGKDFMIAMEKNGVIKGFSRNGKSAAGFPENTHASINSDYFIQRGSTHRKTSLFFLSNINELLELSLSGKVKSKKSIDVVDPKNTQFKLVVDPSGKKMCVAVNVSGEIRILDKELKERCEFEKKLSMNCSLQLYQSGNVTCYAVTDIDAGKLYLFDGKGKLVIDEAIGSSDEIALLFSDGLKEFQLYVVNEKVYQRVLVKRQ